MQQAKRLMGAGIHRHFRLQQPSFQPGVDDPQMRHQGVFATGVQRRQRERSFPGHLRPQRRAAVYHDILQGDMAGVRRGEEQNGIGDLLWAGNLTQRDAELKLLAETADPLLLCIVADPQRALHIGIGRARRHQITAYPAARQLKADG